MNTAIKKWLDAEKAADRARKVASDLERKAHEIPLPKNLRPATAKDIVVGAVIWYKHGDDGHFWQIVDEPLHYGDAFKAYIAGDGCRYGLDDAWIEVEKR